MTEVDDGGSSKKVDSLHFPYTRFVTTLHIVRLALAAIHSHRRRRRRCLRYPRKLSGKRSSRFLSLRFDSPFPSFPPPSHSFDMPLQPQQKDLEDVSDPDDFDPHFRPKDITKDLAKLKKVTATGKKACLGGIAVSLVGSVISTVGLMRNAGESPSSIELDKADFVRNFEGATKFKNWFGVSLGAWILILAAQGVCTWEVLDRAKRHNEKLVNRCKWLYVVSFPFLPSLLDAKVLIRPSLQAAVVLSTVLLLLLLSIWAVKGSFVDPDLSGTSSWVLLVVSHSLLLRS